jgi:DNA mismatch repair protein MutS
MKTPRPHDSTPAQDSEADPQDLPEAMLTPMMQQYLEAKQACPEALLLFRMGDFYELFLEDAVEAARILDLTLTSRNKKDDHPIPMAGVPYHALPAYLPRLLLAGRKVAICEQVEDPKLAKGIVKREVVRIVTPGVVLEESVLDRREPNWLAGLVPQPLIADTPETPETHTTLWGLAWLDVSTGERHASGLPSEALAVRTLIGLEPKEILLPPEARHLIGPLQKALPRAAFTVRPHAAGPLLNPDDPTDAASALVAAYARELHRGGALALRPIEFESSGAAMLLPPSTVRNLELLRSLMDGARERSLLAELDDTKTAMGSRLLRGWLLAPLTDLALIRARHDAVEATLESPLTRASIRDLLRGVLDLERLTGRIVAKTATPRDLSALATSLERVPALSDALIRSELPALSALADRLEPLSDAVALIRRTLVDDPPATLKDGGVIREGADAELDTLIALAREGKDWFIAYGDKLRETSGISSAKIKFNQVFGYFIEVTRANLHLVPDTWLRKQTLANAERYYTLELKEREEQVLGADERRLVLEDRIFTALRESLAERAADIQTLARALAEVDALTTLGEVAATAGWCRPTFTNTVQTSNLATKTDPQQIHTLHLEGGRHPVVERMLPPGTFVPNDLTLDGDRRLVILTGPNMAGKSTVMRQTAIIAILAQMGSFVPAARAHLSLVDKVFTRVGASDDLARGQSTFMVEMTETAEILREATPHSLVILDEIGRGTATWDGLSIAWAVAEHLHDRVRCRALFATHYHELTALSTTREAVINLSIAVREEAQDVVFLRRLIPGGANKSYGIQVARLAGLPDGLLARAREVLSNLEAMAVDPDSRPRLARGGRRPATWQLSLFAPRADDAPPPTDLPTALSEVRRLLDAVEPDNLSPRAALDLVYRLRATLAKGSQE